MSYQPPSDPHFYGNQPTSPPPPPPYPPTSPPPYMGPPPPMQHVHQTTGTDNSRKFLNLSGGALIAVITGILLVCCVGPIVFCFASPFLAAIGDAAKTDPTVTITSCTVSDTKVLPSAKIRFTVKNNGTSDEGFMVKFEVHDANGSRVGDGTEYVSSVGAGQTATEEATVYLDAPGGNKCSVVDVS